MKKLVREALIIFVCLCIGYMGSQYFLKEYRSEVSTSK